MNAPAHSDGPEAPKPSTGRIPVSGPWITEREIAYVTDAVANAWYERAGDWHGRFEKAFAEYVGVRHAVALPSCTSAIHLSLAALGVGPGDEVIVPEITWIASAAPVRYVGATEVFADVDPRTWCLSPEAFEACITPRTKAVIPVDVYGSMADYPALRRIADRHGIAIVEDAAEAVGAVHSGRRAGAWGDTGVFSFHGSKMLTTGEGGMLLTDRDDLLARVLHLRDHGREPGDRYFFNTEVGYKYRMSAMQAALGTAQVERVEELVERKRRIFDWYRTELDGLPGVTLNHEPAGTRNTYWMVTVVLDPALGLGKRELQDRFAAENVDTRPFFHPLSSLPAYRDLPQARVAKDRNRNAYALGPWALNLPSAMNLSREQVRKVCGILRRFVGERR